MEPLASCSRRKRRRAAKCRPATRRTRLTREGVWGKACYTPDPRGSSEDENADAAEGGENVEPLAS